MQFYNDIINNYFLNPRYFGLLCDDHDNQNSLYQIEIGSIKLGKYVIFALQVDSQELIIKDAKYKAYSCGAMIASLEWLCENIIGQKLSILEKIDIPKIVNALKLPDNKLHCALTIEDIIILLQQKIRQKS